MSIPPVADPDARSGLHPDVLRLARAFDMAARAHGSQRRKVTGEPYLAHLSEVAALVAEAGTAEGWGRVDTVIAALLHDAAEDTDMTVGIIAAEFGPAVADIVAPLTDAPEWDALDTAAHKAMQAEAMKGAPVDARRIKIADQTSNCLHRATTIGARDAAKVRAYLDGARVVIERCRGASPLLEDRFDAASGALERALALYSVNTDGERDGEPAARETSPT